MLFWLSDRIRLLNYKQRLLHWAIVFSVIVAYITAYWRQDYTTQLESINWYLLVVHMNVGLLVFILAALMFVRRVNTIAPIVLKQTKRLFMSRAMHRALYLMLLALPLTAYIGTGFDFPFLGLFNLSGFMRIEIMQNLVHENLDLLMITFIEPFAYFHREIGAALIMPILITGHSCAAIFNWWTTHYRFRITG